MTGESGTEREGWQYDQSENGWISPSGQFMAWEDEGGGWSVFVRDGRELVWECPTMHAAITHDNVVLFKVSA